MFAPRQERNQREQGRGEERFCAWIQHILLYLFSVELGFACVAFAVLSAMSASSKQDAKNRRRNFSRSVLRGSLRGSAVGRTPTRRPALRRTRAKRVCASFSNPYQNLFRIHVSRRWRQGPLPHPPIVKRRSDRSAASITSCFDLPSVAEICSQRRVAGSRGRRRAGEVTRFDTEEKDRSSRRSVRTTIRLSGTRLTLVYTAANSRHSFSTSGVPS